VFVSQQMYVIISVPATHYGIWNLITNLPSDSTLILIVFMHDPVASKCSYSTDFHARSQYSDSFQIFFSFRGHHLCFNPPPPTCFILQYHTTYCQITSKGRYLKHVYTNIDILHNEFRSVLKGSSKKFYNFFWHFLVATVGVYWRLFWSTAVCHI